MHTGFACAPLIALDLQNRVLPPLPDLVAIAPYKGRLRIVETSIFLTP